MASLAIAISESKYLLLESFEALNAKLSEIDEPNKSVEQVIDNVRRLISFKNSDITASDINLAFNSGNLLLVRSDRLQIFSADINKLDAVLLSRSWEPAGYAPGDGIRYYYR